MSTPLLILIALLALVVQIVFTPLGAKPLWQSVIFEVAINVFMACLLYVAYARTAKRPMFVPGIEISYQKGLLALTVMAGISAVVGALIGLVLWPLFFGDTPAMDWSTLTQMYPAFVFLDSSIEVYKRRRRVTSTSHL